MFENIRKAYQILVGLLTRLEGKLDVLITEVRVRNAQHDHMNAQLQYLICLERDNRLKREEKEQKERMSIVMPMSDETM